MNNECRFCAIAKNPSQESLVIFENEDLLAFLDINPIFHGHCLLIPKQHYATFYDLPETLIHSFFSHGKIIGKAVEQGTHAEGSFLAMNNIVSQSVPHVHLHIVPRTKGDGLKGFFWPRTKYQNQEAMKEVQLRIKKYL